MMNRKFLPGIAAVTALAAWFLVAPILSMLGPGPFDWHIGQPQALHGGGELLFFMIVAVACLAVRTARWKIGILTLVGLLYARRHGVDLSIFLVYLYAEGMLALGCLLLRGIGFGLLPRVHNLLLAGLFGVVAWSIVLWTLSAFGLGSIISIRIVAVVVLGSALLFSRHPPIAASLLSSVPAKLTISQCAGLAMAVGMFLMLFSKASVVLDYDSMWYGLQGEELLVGQGSLYEAQGLASVAHYYPKLYEALLLPFSGAGSVSMIFGVAIFSWLMIVFTCFAILKEFNVSKTLRICGVMLVASMPALANIAVTAKGDAFSAWMLLMGLLGLIRFRKGAGGVWAWVALCAVVLGVQARLSNLPYAALIVVILSYSIVRRWPSDGVRGVFWNQGAWLGVAVTWLTVMVSARSLLLSGVVLVAPNQVVELQQSFGLSLKYPVGLLPPSEALQRLPIASGLWGILFDPARFPHMIITWVGNVWCFLPLATLLLGAFRPWRSLFSKSWPLLLVGISFFLVMFGYKLLVPAGDGNYFIVPIASLTLWGVVHANEMATLFRGVLNTLLLIFAFIGMAISLVTGSWGPGTRAFDLDMTRMPFELSAHADYRISKADLAGVAKYVDSLPEGMKLVGLERSNDNSDFPAGWWLSRQYENVRAFAWQQPALVASPASFQRYLHDVRIDYLLLPKVMIDTPVDQIVRKAAAEMKATGAIVLAYDDEHYELWKIRRPYVATSKLVGDGRVMIQADHEALCAAPLNGVVTIQWETKGAQVVIEVKSSATAPSSLWAEAGGSGTMTTGPWMTVGGEFIIKSSRDGEKIGRLKVEPQCEGR